MSIGDDFLDSWIDLEEIFPWLPSEPFFVEDFRRDEVGEELARSKFHVAHVDLSNVRSERDLLILVGRVLLFPDFYGENWDSLRDILRARGEDIPWHLAIMFSSCDKFARSKIHAFVRCVSVLHDISVDLSSIVESPYGQLETFYLANWSEFPSSK